MRGGLPYDYSLRHDRRLGLNGLDRMANKKNVNWRKGLIKRGSEGAPLNYYVGISTRFNTRSDEDGGLRGG